MAPTTQAWEPIAALTPLKILVVAQSQATLDAANVRPFLTAITRAFQGGVTDAPDGSEKYYAWGEELGVEIRRACWVPTGQQGQEQTEPPHADLRILLRSCGHLLVVVVLEGTTTAGSKFGQWLDGLAQLAMSGETAGRIGILPINFDTAAEKTSLEQFNEFQRLSIAELGDFSLRPAYLGLLVLQRAWSLLSGDSDERLRLFISHAKRDGAPVALALRSQIESLRWLQRFYDACDILPGTPWRRVLREGVRNSVVVILRSDVYDQRPWCVQEVEWADEFGSPAVVVDVRSSLTLPRESLPVAGMATVRIPDGNLVRILNSALREAMRVRLFRRSVDLLQAAGVLPMDGTVVVPRAALSALGMACEAAKDGPTIEAVVIPEPFREPLRPAAERLVQAYFPTAILGIPRDFVNRPVATPK